MSFRLRGGQPFQKRKPQSSGKSCGKSIKVARVRIIEAGRRAGAGTSEQKCRARILDKARERLRARRVEAPEPSSLSIALPTLIAAAERAEMSCRIFGPACLHLQRTHLVQNHSGSHSLTRLRRWTRWKKKGTRVGVRDSFPSI